MPKIGGDIYMIRDTEAVASRGYFPFQHLQHLEGEKLVRAISVELVAGITQPYFNSESEIAQSRRLDRIISGWLFSDNGAAYTSPDEEALQGLTAGWKDIHAMHRLAGGFEFFTNEQLMEIHTRHLRQELSEVDSKKQDIQRISELGFFEKDASIRLALMADRRMFYQEFLLGGGMDKDLYARTNTERVRTRLVRAVLNREK